MVNVPWCKDCKEFDFRCRCGPASHVRYVVRNIQSGQFVGTRRFNYSEGTTVAKPTKVEFARIFTRKQDADAALPDDDWEVLPVTVELGQ